MKNQMKFDIDLHFILWYYNVVDENRHLFLCSAGVAELADALDSKSSG